MKRNKSFIAILPVIFLMLTSFFLFGKKSGIEGTVVRISGNQMPSPDRAPSAPVPLKASVAVYELTNLNQVVRQGEGASFKTINTKLVKEVTTDDKGRFKVKLAPGRYSLFIKTDNGFYSNSFDSENNINPVEVIKKKMSKVELRLDRDAAY